MPKFNDNEELVLVTVTCVLAEAISLLTDLALEANGDEVDDEFGDEYINAYTTVAGNLIGLTVEKMNLSDGQRQIVDDRFGELLETVDEMLASLGKEESVN